MGDKKVVTGTTICLINNGRILLIKRNKEPYTGKICLPGGKIEFGEQIEACAERELIEETGIKGKCIGIRGVVSEVLKQNSEKIGQYIMFVCEMKSGTEEFTESIEGSLAWYPLDHLPIDQMVPSDYRMIMDFLIKKTSVPLMKVEMEKINENYAMEAHLQ